MAVMAPMAVMTDVIVVGAGPAGSVAAAILARAGVRVTVIDRARFPRDKLCGDTVNPGTLALLRRMEMARGIERAGLPLTGMTVSAGQGTAVVGRYPRELVGRALSRADLDSMLLDEAMAAGAQFEPGVAVREALVEDAPGGRRVTGIAVRNGRGVTSMAAPIVIAADGRHSTLAFGLGLAGHPVRPRRWAIGAYVEGGHATGDLLGEMHIRHDRYLGVAPLPGGLMNVCLVQTARGGIPRFSDAEGLLRRAIAGEPLVAHLAGAKLVRPPIVLGPLAVDVRAQAPDGLILAGDAAGFIDPMTGDGLRFAVRGGALAAAAAIEVLTAGWTGVHRRLAARRRSEFASKIRFNRFLRALVGSAAGIALAARSTRMAPAFVQKLVDHAGDCALAQETQEK